MEDMKNHGHDAWSNLTASQKLEFLQYKSEKQGEIQKPARKKVLLKDGKNILFPAHGGIAEENKEEDGQGGSRPKWLTDIRDSKLRRPSHPEYDPTTLYIPPDAEKDLTPAKKQFWSFKKNKFDESTILSSCHFFNKL